ncbi:MAG: DEAD/DEAH box helicase [Alphaproteobacteria bacterium]|nr:DEAD/DEAH box helicase [Alphaproteobacteria bacterium]
MRSFSDLGLSKETLAALENAGHVVPTKIQEEAIPCVLEGRDVLGCARTGTGKTASFVLPLLDILKTRRAKARMPRSLILEPTRELAAQVAENFMLYGKNHKLSLALLIGGDNILEQIRVLNGSVDVLVATPGRLIDLFERGNVMLADTRILVIDEADRMLDMGFMPDIEKIVSFLPSARQTMMFSATMPKEIQAVAEKFLNNPKKIMVSPPASTAVNISQKIIPLEYNDEWLKRYVLRFILRRDKVESAFIFCNKKIIVAHLQASLKKHGFNAEALHGDMSQSERNIVLARFRNKEIPLLVCSDVAARGLDVDSVSHVFNFDMPFNAEDYVHRIGRTARASQSGTAYTFETPDDEEFLNNIEKLIKQKIEKEIIEALPKPDLSRSKNRGGKHKKDNRSKAKIPPKARAKTDDSNSDRFDEFNSPAFLRRR